MNKRLTSFSALPCLVGAAALSICLSSSAADIGREPSTCIPDRAKLLSLDLDTFDQKPAGWRGVASKGQDCELAVADLIAEYRATNSGVLNEFGAYLLYWHEGQIRAFQGQDDRAVALFKQSRLPSPRFDMWNHYVDATLAFLAKDRPALLRARTALADMPPEVYKPLPAPMNLDVVDGLLSCFDRPYRDAYGCRP